MRRGLVLVREALRIDRNDLESREGVAKWLHALGDLYMDRNDPAKALEVFWLSASLREGIQHADLPLTLDKIKVLRQRLGERKYAKLANGFSPEKSDFAAFLFD
jgi:hypothetical protein